ncbi:uncharacterized protein LOC135125422 [Zophobas morio]|uniref:uncharacterized protein LOC135125422 n=1 Tax=Zophobas morio TaxID=2755281 RepID=UPI0030833AFF
MMAKIRAENRKLRAQLKQRRLKRKCRNFKRAKNLAIGHRGDKEVHVGRGVFLPIPMYDTIVSQSKSGQQFVRSVSAAIFGYETLAKCSVTGKFCNRTKTIKPQLDPTKLRAVKDIYRHYLESKGMPQNDVEYELEKTHMYIARKIADVCKQQKKTEESDKT